MYFDRVTTQFAGSSDVRSSRRGFVGVGGGITVTFWRRLMVEGEVRGASVAERDEPMFSFLLKAGLQISYWAHGRPSWAPVNFRLNLKDY